MFWKFFTYDYIFKSSYVVLKKCYKIKNWKINGVIAITLTLDKAIRFGNAISESIYYGKGLIVFWIGYLLWNSNRRYR